LPHHERPGKPRGALGQKAKGGTFARYPPGTGAILEFVAGVKGFAVLQLLGRSGRKWMNIAQILKSKGRAVATARPNATLSEVIAKLAQKKIGAIVMVGDNGELVGILSERDVIRQLAERGEAALNEPASKSMTSSVISCHESSTLEEMMELMTQGRFRHVPVIEDGALVGIVSIGDIVKHHVAEVEMEVTAMRDYFATG
jgi:CBS domain-containing protein